MKVFKALCLMMVLGVAVLPLVGCQKEEGPAERLGKQVDEAATEAGKEAEKAAEEVKEAVE